MRGRRLRLRAAWTAGLCLAAADAVRAQDPAPAPVVVAEAKAPASRLFVSGDGKRVGAAEKDSIVRVFDPASGARTGAVRALVFMGGFCGAGGDDFVASEPLKGVGIWNPTSSTKRCSVTPPPADPGDVKSPFASKELDTFGFLALPKRAPFFHVLWMSSQRIGTYAAGTGKLLGSCPLRRKPNLNGPRPDVDFESFFQVATSADGAVVAAFDSSVSEGVAKIRVLRRDASGVLGVRADFGKDVLACPDKNVFRAVLSDDGRFAVAIVDAGAPPPESKAPFPGALTCWSLEDGSRRWTRDVPDLREFDFATSSDAVFVPSAAGVETLDLATGKTRDATSAAPEPIRALAASPDGSRLYGAGASGRVFAWDLAPQSTPTAQDAKPTTAGGPVFSCGAPLVDLAVSPDGTFLAAGGEDGVVRVVDQAAHKVIASLEGHRSAATDVAFVGGDPAWLMTRSSDRLRVWNPQTGFLRKEFAATPDGKEPAPLAAAASPVGHAVVFARKFGSPVVWDADATTQSWEKFLMAAPRALAWSPDGSRVAACDGDREFALLAGYGVFDRRGGKAVWAHHVAAGALVSDDEKDLRDHRYFASRFAPDGARLLQLADKGRVRANDAATGRPQWICDLPGVAVRDVAFRADGAALLVTDHGVYDLDTRVGTATSAADLPVTATCAAFSPKSGVLFLGLSDGTIVRAIRPR